MSPPLAHRAPTAHQSSASFLSNLEMSSNVNIKWNDPNTYKTQPTKKQQIETDVKGSSATTSAAGRGATDAIIMCVDS